MAAVTIHSDFRAWEEWNLSLPPPFPLLLPWSDETRCHDLNFFWYWILSWLFHSPPPSSRRLFSSSLLSAIRVVVAQTVKHLPAMRETRVWSLGREDPLEKAMAIHSSTLAWKIPWTEEPDRLQSMGSQRVHTTEWLHFHFHFHPRIWRCYFSWQSWFQLVTHPAWHFAWCALSIR